MIKSDFDMSKIKEAISLFSKRMNEVFQPIKEVVEEDKKTVRKLKM